MRAYFPALFTSSLVVFSCIGLARFAFGMILPNMQEDLQMSTIQAGWVGSANFIGYFSGLFFISFFYNKLGSYKLIKRSLIFQGISIIAMALAWEYTLASFAYFASGFFGAFANIAIMSYITQVVPSEHKAKAAGLVIVGAGSAIMFSGIVVPLLESAYGLLSWKITWFSFGVIILIIATMSNKGLCFPKHTHHKVKNATTLKFKTVIIDRSFIHVALMYMIFGITYVVYITFFVLAVQTQWDVNTNISGSFWTLLGFASLFAGPIFGIVADKIGTYKALAIIFVIQTTAHGILAFDAPLFLLWFSAVLFGASTWGIPSLMTVLSSELYGAEHTAKILSWITMFFATGQIVGPVAAGWLTDLFGTFSYAFGICAFFTFNGVLISIYSHRHKHA